MTKEEMREVIERVTEYLAKNWNPKKAGRYNQLNADTIGKYIERYLEMFEKEKRKK
jgi:hypothetical protein